MNYNGREYSNFLKQEKGELNEMGKKMDLKNGTVFDVFFFKKKIK